MPKIGEEFTLKTNLSCNGKLEHAIGDTFIFREENIEEGELKYTLKPKNRTINLSCKAIHFYMLFTNKQIEREDKIKLILDE